MTFSFVKFQIGKNGLTEGTVDALSLTFKNHKSARVSVLKSAGRDRNSIQAMAEDLSKRLHEKDKKYKFNIRVIGFTIVLSKQSS